jgi:hypothetical protein
MIVYFEIYVCAGVQCGNHEIYKRLGKKFVKKL